jgi:hypothetical protein
MVTAHPEQSNPCQLPLSLFLSTMYVTMQATKQQHRSGKIMLEGWVDDVLTNSPWLQQQQHTSTGSVRGAVAAGLSRKQLLAAGLSVGAVEQLHRCLYVYSMGFVDTVKVSRCSVGWYLSGVMNIAMCAVCSCKDVYCSCNQSACPNVLARSTSREQQCGHACKQLLPKPVCSLPAASVAQVPQSVCSWCHDFAGAARSE